MNVMFTVIIVSLIHQFLIVKEVLEYIYVYTVVNLGGQEFMVKSGFTNNHNLVKHVL